jgi:isopenicillin-N epimerase
VSWGWLPDKRSEHPLQDYFEMQGTREFAQFLATPDAIDFQQKNDWGAVRARCHKLVCRARLAIMAMSNLPPLSPLSTEWFMQLVSIPLPQGVNTGELKTKLYERYRIEVPLVEWSGKPYVRVSAQAHTRDEDIEQFIQAIKTEVKF